MSLLPAATGGEWQAPSLRRRFACLLYESLLLFGVGLVSGAIGTLLLKITGLASATSRDVLLQGVGIAVYGLYFVWFWTRRGQTLPMQTWRIQLVTSRGERLGIGRALLRYAACALWIAPAAVLAKVNHWPPSTTMAAVAIGIAAYGLLALLHPQRQFWHDALCGTRLVTVDAGKPAVA
ncbi:RDD family protein [Piscinibacter gummiphilus]|uniref:RDD family protein n=1 Tax=Piscinibacter gummiphilus TaxID=946333 RepID=A0ABZ0D777_9BURK|nr:RDD family protein [Piscinibacter gummiphilus]WOB10559.1 RDD family protein [Piscinibacter gummiphilus]